MTIYVQNVITPNMNSEVELAQIPTPITWEDNAAEHNAFIHDIVCPICAGIDQEFTAKILENPKRYFRINQRHLYNYDLKTLIDIDNSMADRGYLNGDEVREDAGRNPAGLTEFKVLENYIPYDMSGAQNKLTGTKQEENNA